MSLLTVTWSHLPSCLPVMMSHVPNANILHLVTQIRKPWKSPFLTWHLTYDLGHWTCPRYHDVKLCNNSCDCTSSCGEYGLDYNPIPDWLKTGLVMVPILLYLSIRWLFNLEPAGSSLFLLQNASSELNEKIQRSYSLHQKKEKGQILKTWGKF